MKTKFKLAEKISEMLLNYSKKYEITLSKTFKHFGVPWDLEKLNYKTLTGIKGTLNQKLRGLL